MCNSPHVVKCYDIVENKRYKIFVMEYCNRGSLQDELRKKKAYPVNDALAILKQIILGLSVQSYFIYSNFTRTVSSTETLKQKIS